MNQCSHDMSSFRRAELGGLTTVGGMTVKSTYALVVSYQTSTEQHLREQQNRRGERIRTYPLTQSKYLGAPYMQGLLWRRLMIEL